MKLKSIRSRLNEIEDPNPSYGMSGVFGWLEYIFGTKRINAKVEVKNKEVRRIVWIQHGKYRYEGIGSTWREAAIACIEAMELLD